MHGHAMSMNTELTIVDLYEVPEFPYTSVHHDTLLYPLTNQVVSTRIAS